jgi:NitT/TauT family transport system permease protein
MSGTDTRTAGATRSRMSLRWVGHPATLQIVLVAAAIVAWQVVTWTKTVDPSLLPSPADVWDGMRTVVPSQEFRSALAITGEQVGIAMAISVAAGLLLGVSGWLSHVVYDSFFPWLVLVNSIPSVLFYPIAIVLFGLGAASIVALCVCIGSMPIAAATYAGFSGVDRSLLLLGRSYGLSNWGMVRRIVAPAALPVLVGGFRTSFTLSFVVVVASQYLLSGGGLGYELKFAYEAFQINSVYALVVITLVISLLCQALLALGLRALTRRR